MKIIWLGHGSFRIEIADQVLLVDPWLSGNPMFPDERRGDAVGGATAIFLTHGHGDHSSDVLTLSQNLSIPLYGQFDLMSHWGETQGISANGFNRGGTVRLGDVAVSMVPASHSSTLASPEGPKAAGTEVGFVIAGEGHTIYFSGDTAIMADMDWIADYHKPDIGILSAGGYFTMDMAQAAYAAKRYFDFKTVIPCHYRTFPVLEQDAAKLVAGLPGVQVIEPQVLEPIEI